MGRTSRLVRRLALATALAAAVTACSSQGGTQEEQAGGGGPVLTGPSFVDQSNIEQIVPYAEKNTR